MTVVKSGAVSSLVPLVAKPGRYSGPVSSAHPGRFDAARVRVVVVHPDHFENGMAHAVTRAAFRAVESVTGAAADLSFLPWSDLDDLLAASGAPPWGIESHASLAEFDLIVFTPGAPLQYVEVARLLMRAGLDPLAERRVSGPLVGAIGPLLANPLPLADLVDVILLGEPDGVLPGVVRALLVSGPADGAGRAARRTALAACPGVWSTDRNGDEVVPALAGPGMLGLMEPMLHPLVESAGDGLLLEIRRGASGARFQHHWRPADRTWFLPAEEALECADRALKDTGLDRVELVGDDPYRHPRLLNLVESINRRFPGVRIDMADYGVIEPRPALAREILRGRRGPIVLSPWAATDRLRAELGIDGTNDELIAAAATALRGGAGPLTIRLGLGWPGETDRDRQAVVELMSRLRREAGGATTVRPVLEIVPYLSTPGSDLEGLPAAHGLDLAAVLSDLGDVLLAQGPLQIRMPPAERVAIEAAILAGGREIGARLIAAAVAGAAIPDPVRHWQPEPWRAAFPESTAPEVIRPAGTAVAAAGSRPRPAGAVVDATPDRAADVERAPGVDGASEDPAGYGRKSRRKGPASARPASRYRMRFAKTHQLSMTSHLDVGRLFERALRRLERTRMAWHNRPVKLSFGPPLPLGWTSQDEYVDLQFAEDVPESMPPALGEVLDDGLSFLDMKPIRSSVESLAHAIDRAHYILEFGPEFRAAWGGMEPSELNRRLTDGAGRIRAAREILVRKNPQDELHRVDVRSGVLSATVEPWEGPDSGLNPDAGLVPNAGLNPAPRLHLHLTLGVPGSVRPEILLPVLLGDDRLEARLVRIHRVSLRIAGAGRELTPLEVVELDFPWWRESPRRSAAGGPRA